MKDVVDQQLRDQQAGFRKIEGRKLKEGKIESSGHLWRSKEVQQQIKIRIFNSKCQICPVLWSQDLENNKFHNQKSTNLHKRMQEEEFRKSIGQTRS